jgi:LysM repeat protein
VFGALAVCLAGTALLASRQNGWLGDLARPTGKKTETTSTTGEIVPPPDDELLETPLDIELAQSEPPVDESILEPAPKTKRGRNGRSVEMFDESEIEQVQSTSRPPRRKSPVVTAGFEEDAPPAPEVIEDDEPVGRRPPKAGREKIARKSTDSAKSASTRQADETDSAKKYPLMSSDQIQALINDGDFVEAQKELSQWYWQKPSSREEILPNLHKMSRALYFSPQPQYYEPYVVKSGDQLRVIGQKFKLSWEYLAKLNRVDAKKIRAGQKLKVVPGPFSVIVFLDRFELVVHLDGSFVKSYRVGVGKDGTTPIGTFPVKNKMVNPTYTGPDGVISADDPKNPLGERWIDIGDSFGIHGTIEPDSIGKKESRGCVRMLNSDVEEVYDFLVVGSEVKIVRK